MISSLMAVLLVAVFYYCSLLTVGTSNLLIWLLIVFTELATSN